MAEEIFTVTKSEDPRLTQPAHSFCAAQGASAISIVQVAAATQSASNWTFSIIPPSPQVGIQKCPLLDATLTFQVVCVQSDGSGVNGNSIIPMDPNFAPFAVWGRDIGIGRAAPLGQLVSAFNITINNAAVQQQNVPLPDLVHVLEGPKGRAGHGTMMRTPFTASWDDARGSLWSLGASGASMLAEGDVGPGAYNVVYCDDQGNELAGIRQPGQVQGSGWYPYNSVTGTPDKFSTFFQNGVPVTSPIGAGYAHAIYVRVRLVDAVMCSPLGFNYDTSFKETVLYGISSMTIQAQLTTGSVARIIQNDTTSGCIMVNQFNLGTPGLQMPTAFQGTSGDLQNVANNATGNNSAVKDVKIWMTYLSPSIQSTLPPRSIATLCNLQYFQQRTSGGLLNTGIPGITLSTQQINFQSVTFSNVPDLICISIRPDPLTMTASDADFCCTIPDSGIQQFVFANQSGLFSGWTAEALNQMSRNNGSRASLAQYGGSEGKGMVTVSGQKVAAGGSILLIRPGVDFPLPTGVTVGSTGQVQLSFTINFNATGSYVTAGPRVYICTVTAISSGFFVTDNGVSRQLLVGLDEQTILNAPLGPDRFMAQRLAGGAFHHGMSNGGNGLWDKLKSWGAKAASVGHHVMENKDHYAHLARTAMGHAQAARGMARGMMGKGLGGSGMHESLASRLG